MALSFVNQVGAPNGMNQAAPGSFIPESFVRWSQDVLYDRVGYLRRRAPYKTQALYSYIDNVWTLDQPSVDGERIIGLVTSRNPNNEDRIGIVVTTGTSTSIIFYDTSYHKKTKTTIPAVANQGVVFTRPALSGGAFIGILDNYGVAKSNNKHYLYYWRGGTGVDSTVNNCTLGITDDTLNTQNTDHSSKTITQPTPAVANGYPILLTNAGATGLTVGTTYYVVNAGASTFQLASSVGGSALNIGSRGRTSRLQVGCLHSHACSARVSNR